MDVIVDGRVTDISDVHPLNVPTSISVIVGGITMDVSDEQTWKAQSSPMDVSEDGR